MSGQQSLGFIGLGKMGLPMASRLLAAGHRLLAFDVRSQACDTLLGLGARIAKDARAVAEEATTVFLSLPTPQTVCSVIEGDAESRGILGAGSMKVIVDLSTTGASITRQLAQKAGQFGVRYVDSPVSGGVRGAEQGTLAVMCACERQVFESLTHTLNVFGKVFHVGEVPGLGQSMKLANNMLSATAMAASAEAIAFGVKQGLDPLTMTEIINVSTGANTAIRDKFPKAIIPRTFNFGFASGLMHKDVQLCLDEARSCGVPMLVGEAVGSIWSDTVKHLGSESDFTEIAKLIEDRAGLVIRTKRSSSK